ncbi:Uncharacterized protein SCF082_LOCUS32375 [Durusdinium trenchii]|uniref:Uncharacterized protein n=1 Tax=Durusdinium trenchii TaxID=1381693 RepID=A0ABP0NDV4_9DINO
MHFKGSGTINALDDTKHMLLPINCKFMNKMTVDEIVLDPEAEAKLHETQQAEHVAELMAAEATRTWAEAKRATAALHKDRGWQRKGLPRQPQQGGSYRPLLKAPTNVGATLPGLRRAPPARTAGVPEEKVFCGRVVPEVAGREPEPGVDGLANPRAHAELGALVVAQVLVGQAGCGCVGAANGAGWDWSWRCWRWQSPTHGPALAPGVLESPLEAAAKEGQVGADTEQAGVHADGIVDCGATTSAAPDMAGSDQGRVQA